MTMTNKISTTQNGNNDEVTYFIAVDPGFDAFKVIINGMYFLVPREIVKVDANKLKSLSERSEDYICHQANGESHYIGAYANLLNTLNYDANPSNRFISVEYFTTNEFTISLESVIAYAIYRYNKDVLNIPYTNNKVDLNINSRIYLAFALPHSYCDKYGEIICQQQSKHHEFTLNVGKTNTQINVSFDLNANNIISLSQTIAVLMGRMIKQDISSIEKLLPTLIIDGGYLTLGIVTVNPKFIVNDDLDESNTAFTMNAINKELEKDIVEQTGRTDIRDYAIDNFIETEPELRYIDTSTNKVSYYKIKERKDAITKNTADKLVAYLNKKFNNLLSYRSIHIAGGTGIIFADRLKEEYVHKLGVLKEDEIIIVQGANYNPEEDNHFYDKKNHTISLGYLSDDKYSAAFGIAVGTYLSLNNHFNG